MRQSDGLTASAPGSFTTCGYEAQQGPRATEGSPFIYSVVLGHSFPGSSDFFVGSLPTSEVCLGPFQWQGSTDISPRPYAQGCPGTADNQTLLASLTHMRPLRLV